MVSTLSPCPGCQSWTCSQQPTVSCRGHNAAHSFMYWYCFMSIHLFSQRWCCQVLFDSPVSYRTRDKQVGTLSHIHSSLSLSHFSPSSLSLPLFLPLLPFNHKLPFLLSQSARSVCCVWASTGLHSSWTDHQLGMSDHAPSKVSSSVMNYAQHTYTCIYRNSQFPKILLGERFCTQIISDYTRPHKVHNHEPM